MDNDLLGKSTVRRRKAALLAMKSNSKIDCEILIEALLLEESTSNNWETLVVLMNILGRTSCTTIADHIFGKYILVPSAAAMVDIRAARAYIRLRRNDLSDIAPILQLNRLGRYDIMEGALEALGYDQMKPSVDDQNLLIELFWDFGSDRLRGRSDPRYGLAAACAGWTSSRVSLFSSIAFKMLTRLSLTLQKKRLKGSM